MSKQKEATIQFVNFLVKESHIVFNEPGKHKVNIGIDPKGYIFKDLNQFHLQLEVDIKDEENKFHIELATISIFEYPEDADLEAYKNGLFILNAPSIVFPYLRSYISALTALSGMPTLTLPTLNLGEVGSKLKENIEEVAE